MSVEDFEKLKINVANVKEDNNRLNEHLLLLNKKIEEQRDQITVLEKKETSHSNFIDKLKAILL